MARHNEVAQAFLDGQTEQAGNMQTEGYTVFSYQELIAIRVDEAVHITTKKWSRTTSLHTNAIRYALSGAGYKATGYDVGGTDVKWEVWEKTV